MRNKRQPRFATQRVLKEDEVFLREPVAGTLEESFVSLGFCGQNVGGEAVELEVELEDREAKDLVCKHIQVYTEVQLFPRPASFLELFENRGPSRVAAFWAQKNTQIKSLPGEIEVGTRRENSLDLPDRLIEVAGQEEREDIGFTHIESKLGEFLVLQEDAKDGRDGVDVFENNRRVVSKSPDNPLCH